MITLLRYLIYYTFLIILSIVAGFVLPLTLVFGALDIYYHEYLRGGILLIFTVIGLYVVDCTFEYRKKLKKRNKKAE